jgi:pimeloyl-ACP methyl ester carboxylesterase
MTLSSDAQLYYQDHDFTDPWSKSEAVLLMHGNFESSDAWYRWVPVLSRHLRVIRADMRGFGSSTPMPADFAWTLDMIVDDFTRLLDHLGVASCHVVGAKIGGTIARVFAARRPDRTTTLTVVSSPPGTRDDAATAVATRLEALQKHGAEHYVRQNMGKRLGSSFSAEGAEWWTHYMGRSPVSTQIGFARLISFADITPDIRRIRCPTLVMTTDESALATVEATRAWQQLIPGSELRVLSGNSYHPAVTHAEECAHATLDFIRRHGGADRGPSERTN